MTPPRAGTWWVIGTVAVAVLFFLAIPDQPEPWSLASTADDGTDIMRRVLVELDVTVAQRPASELPGNLAAHDVVVVFEDRLTDADEQVLVDHVAAGGRLVVADPRSPLAGATEVVAGTGFSGVPDCGLLPDDTTARLARDMAPSAGTVALPSPIVPDVFTVPDAATDACWRDDATAFVAVLPGQAVVAHRSGDDGEDAPPETADAGRNGDAGEVVVLGDPLGLSNATIQLEPDMARLVGLLLPDDARGRVVVAVGDAPLPAPTRPVGALPDNLVAAMWIAGLATLLYALGRARRHGPVVSETPPVQVPASELAAGIAELLQRHGRVEHAAGRVRDALRTELASLLGGGDDDPAVLVVVTTAATGLDHDVVAAAVGTTPVTTTDGLVATTRAATRVRRALNLLPEAVQTSSPGRLDDDEPDRGPGSSRHHDPPSDQGTAP